ncbi:hypothetical protein [Streptomyces sp. NPDC051452]|uniref:hypothetical protein n=1 Tax=Streptomyces sp. NPDC051452 TaxID=3365654 RepID=UPI00379604DE
MHFHAVIRLGGPDGTSKPPPPYTTVTVLTDAVRAAAAGPRHGRVGRGRGTRTRLGRTTRRTRDRRLRRGRRIHRSRRNFYEPQPARSG